MQLNLVGLSFRSSARQRLRYRSCRERFTQAGVAVRSAWNVKHAAYSSDGGAGLWKLSLVADAGEWGR